MELNLSNHIKAKAPKRYTKYEVRTDTQGFLIWGKRGEKIRVLNLGENRREKIRVLNLGKYRREKMSI